MAILELGCGHKKADAAVGLDLFPWPGVDVIADLNRPLPFHDNQFDEVWARHIIEHLDGISCLLEEIYRVARPGARVHIVTPHFTSPNSWTDPTHKQHLGYYSLDFYCPTGKEDLWTHKCRFKVVEKKLDFLPRTLKFWVPWFGNRFPRTWEKYYCYRWPARNLFVTLEVIK